MLPFIEKRERLLLTTGMHSLRPVEVYPPGMSQETNRNQHLLIRAKRSFESESEWFSTEDSVDINADTVVVGGYIMRKTGRIESNAEGESRFIADFKESLTDYNLAKHIETPPLYEMDCLILEDGRAFFVNGERKDYIKIMGSLGIATSGS